jgi:hypothetical protein
MRSIFALAALPLVVLGAPAPVKDAALGAEKYIVVLKPESSIKSLGFTKRGSLFEAISPFHTYEVGTFKGFAAVLTPNQVTSIRADSKVRVDGGGRVLAGKRPIFSQEPGCIR